MIGWPGGIRRTKDNSDGRTLKGGSPLLQYISCRTPEEVDAWKVIFPDGAIVRVVRMTEHRFLVNSATGATWITQDQDERDQWAKTFVQSNIFEHFARWEGQTLHLGSMAKPPEDKPVEQSDAEKLLSAEDEWRGMSDAALRSAAARLGLPNVDPKESREMLIARMKRHAGDPNTNKTSLETVPPEPKVVPADAGNRKTSRKGVTA